MSRESTTPQLSQKQQVLAAIVARASTPFERLQACYESCQTSPNHIDHTRYMHLKQILSGDRDDDVINDFCAQLHLDYEHIIQMLSPVQLKGPAQLPYWIKPLEDILAAPSVHFTGEAYPYVSDRCLLPDWPIPFEDLLLPFVQYARNQFQARIAKAYSCLSEGAHIQMEQWLLQSLSKLASHALQREFSIFRMLHMPFAYDFREDATHHDLYYRFVKDYREGNFWSFFSDYSVLARLLLLKLEQWIDTCQEFVLRLEADSATLADVFFQGQPLGSVVALEAGCSDPHHDGRSVFLLSFNEERRLVYKPRNMSVDQAFSDLLTWTTTSELLPTLRGLRVVNKETYGWMEYAPWMPCQTTQEVKHYYQRTGMLLCLLYLLGGTDMHCANLIACGDMPMLIDLETVMGADYPRFHLPEMEGLRGMNAIEHTILRSGLLPGKFTDIGIHGTIDVSALGGGIKQGSSESFPCWKHINTNAMVLKNEQVNSGGYQYNQVLLNGTVMQTLDYQEEIIAGLRKMYHLLLTKRTVLLAPEGPLSAFENCLLRSVVRPTFLYGKVLDSLTSPSLLRDGADRWLELQVLQRSLLNAADPSKLQVLINAEISALDHLDIPWFGTYSQSQDLLINNTMAIKDVFACSALELLHQRLAQMKEADLIRQISFLHATFSTVSSVEPHLMKELESATESLDDRYLLTSESLMNVVDEVAQRLMQISLRDRHGKITWLGFCHDSAKGGYQLQPIGFDFYEGSSGIAFFLAAYAWQTGRTVYRDFAMEIVQPFIECLSRSSGSAQQELNSMNIGGAAGLGAWVYVLTRLSQWLDRSDMLDAATQSALLITSERIQADRHLDVIAGASGVLLGLLALYEVTADKEILQRAMLCGLHLLAQRMELKEGVKAWPGHDGIIKTGFSHGAAGIAYALLRLYAVTQRQEFWDAACEAINYERLTFVPEVGNWPSYHPLLTSNTPQSYKTSWCYGATGIGLARLGGLKFMDVVAVRQELEVALSTTLAYGLPSLDSLCCGNFGRIDFLLASAHCLQRPALLGIAQKQASALVHRATQQGGFHLLAGLPRNASNPGLFQGLAGIGYELLRMTNLKQVPSVLLWE